MSLKYKENVRVVITAIDENDTMSKQQELITNSQDALWHFIDAYQQTFIQRMDRVDDEDTELMLNKQQLFSLYENQDNFFGKDAQFVRLDLSDMGLLGFLWILNTEKDFDALLENFMSGEMEISTSKSFESKTVIL